MDGNWEVLERGCVVLVEQYKMVGQLQQCIKRFAKKQYQTTAQKDGKDSNNITSRTTSATWRIFAELNIHLSPEPAEKQANEDGSLTSIEVSIFYVACF